jgi:hypothetical protein
MDSQNTFISETLAPILFYGGLGVALIICVIILYRSKTRHKRKRKSKFLPYESPRSSTQYWSNNHEYLHSRYDDMRKKLTKVEHVIQTYSRNGSIPQTAHITGYSERKVKRILIRAGKYTTQEEAKRIFDKYR